MRLKFVFVFFLILVSSYLCIVSVGTVVLAEEARLEAEVIEVIDSATIIVSYSGYSTSCVYIGVSAPESESPIGLKGSEARQFNRELVEGKSVSLEFDEQKYDKYGRLMAYVHCDDVFVNAEIIRQGHGSVMILSPNTKYAEQFLKLEAEARENKRGIWAEPIKAADVSVQPPGSLERQIELIMKKIDELNGKIDQLFQIMRQLQAQLGNIPAGEHKSEQKEPDEQMDAASPESQSDQVVYVTTSGKKYHKLGCRFLMGNFETITIEEAKRRGLQPCSFCFPKKAE